MIFFIFATFWDFFGPTDYNLMFFPSFICDFLGPRGPLVLPLVDPYTRTPVRAKNLDTYIQAYMPHESSGDSSNEPIGHMGSPRRLP